MVEQVTRPPTVVEIASEQIQQAIFSGELRMGQPLREIHLMKALNVSRGTVRQALQMLQDKGLVAVVTHQGATVASPSCEDVIQNYTTRALIEPYAALIAFERGKLDASCVSQLRGILERMSRAEKSGEIAEITKFDIEFHMEIFQQGHNDVLLRMFHGILLQARMCMFQNILSSGIPMSPNPHEHHEIVSAIEAQQPDAVAEQLCRHSLKALDNYLAHTSCDSRVMDKHKQQLIRRLPWLRSGA